MKASRYTRRAATLAAHGALLTMLSPSGAGAAPRGGGGPSATLLTPHLGPGGRVVTIFPKTTSFTIPGFDPKVSRMSDTDTIVVRSVGAGVVTADESYEYDGSPPGRDVVEVRDSGRTNCVDGRCRTNDQPGAPLFNPLLWGDIPRRLTVGRHWIAAIGKPWEIGPAESEMVTVVRIDPRIGLVTLGREGSGDGVSTHDARLPTLTITGGGQSMKVTVTPGRAHWSGSATIVQGMTLADQIAVDRPVDLVTQEDWHIPARQRTYTIFARVENVGSTT